MDFILAVGSFAAILTTISFLPQVVQAHKSRQTKDLSMSMCLLLLAGLVLWIIYGILDFSLPVIMANGVTLILVFYLVVLKVKHG